jgi:hypothetical protein
LFYLDESIWAASRDRIPKRTGQESTLKYALFLLSGMIQGLSVCQLSRAFGCDGGRVEAILHNGSNDSKAHDRHFVFNDDSEIEILEWVQTQAEKYAPITRTEVQPDWKVKYSRSVSRERIDSFIVRHRAN